MNTRKIVVWIALLALMLISAATVFAKEVGQLTITGPGIATPIVFTDRAKLLDESENLYDYTKGGKNPPAWITSESPYFELVRNFMDGDKILATDRMRYYPAPSGKIGAIFYVGMDDPGMSDQKNLWFPMNTAGDEWLQGVLTKNGVDIAGLLANPKLYEEAAPAAAPAVVAPAEAAPGTVAVATPALAIPWALIGGGLAIIAALGALAWAMRARRPLQRA